MSHAIIGDIIRAGNVDTLTDTQQLMYHLGKGIGTLSRNSELPTEVDNVLWWAIERDRWGAWIVNDLDKQADDKTHIVNDDMSAFVVGLVEGHTGNADTSRWRQCKKCYVLCECSRGLPEVQQ